MSERVFVVFGETGKYSDHYNWTVAAYPTEAEAKSHADAANAWCREHGYDCDSPPWDEEVNCPWDKDFSGDYTGTSYTVVEVPVGGYPPPAQGT